jgi:hypothetical protein
MSVTIPSAKQASPLHSCSNIRSGLLIIGGEVQFSVDLTTNISKSDFWFAQVGT